MIEFSPKEGKKSKKFLKPDLTDEYDVDDDLEPKETLSTREMCLKRYSNFKKSAAVQKFLCVVKARQILVINIVTNTEQLPRNS